MSVIPRLLSDGDVLKTSVPDGVFVPPVVSSTQDDAPLTDDHNSGLITTTGCSEYQCNIKKLKSQLEEQEQKLQLAGKIGNELLSENQKLTQQNDNQSREYTARIEALEQERHSTKLLLDQRIQENKNLADELDLIKSKYEQQRKEFEMREQSEHLNALNLLKKKAAALESELQASILTASQSEQKLAESQERVASLQQEACENEAKMNETCSEELNQLYSKVTTLNNEKHELTVELGECKRSVEQLQLALSQAQTALRACEVEMEEQQCQTTGYFNALECAREEVKDVKVELDMLRMESQDQKKKGNSLFSEVEDRRVAAEKQMITLKVQNETLKKQYNMTKENLNRLKLQLAMLLQMSTGRADAQHIESLQQQLFDARQQIAKLTRELNAAQKSGPANLESWQKILEEHSSRNVFDFFKAEMNRKDEESEKLQAAHRALRFQEYNLSQNMMECKQKNYQLEREKDRLVGLNMKLQIRIDELEIKYEPEKHKAANKKPTYKMERVPLNKRLPFGNKENQEKSASPPRPATKTVPKIKPDDRDGSLRAEVINKETQPSAGIDYFIGSAPRTTLNSQKPKLTYHEARYGTKKAVTMSSDVKVIEIEPRPNDKDTNSDQDQGQPKQGRIKGSKVMSKVIKVPSGPSIAERHPDCKQQ